MIFKKLSAIDDRYREIEQMLTLPEVISNNKDYQRLIKEYNSVAEVVAKYREYTVAAREMNECDEMMRDSWNWQKQNPFGYEVKSSSCPIQRTDQRYACPSGENI